MKKIADITAFLINLNLVAAENIESFVDDPKVVPSGTEVSHDSLVLYRCDYTCTVNIDDYPHKEHAAELLFGHVCAWLMNNDCERLQIAQPRIDVDILDNDTANIEIQIDFEEDVLAIEDPAGDIFLNNKYYRILDSDIFYAETGEVTTP